MVDCTTEVQQPAAAAGTGSLSQILNFNKKLLLFFKNSYLT
jgi:hypothetical protein